MGEKPRFGGSKKTPTGKKNITPGRGKGEKKKFSTKKNRQGRKQKIHKPTPQRWDPTPKNVGTRGGANRFSFGVTPQKGVEKQEQVWGNPFKNPKGSHKTQWVVVLFAQWPTKP